MQNAESFVAVLPSWPDSIQCELLPAFDRTDHEQVRRAFQSAVVLSFQQAWLPAEEAGFFPGEVRMGWRERSLLVFAELTDLDIFHDATGANQRMWELGDVFEMFFKVAEMESYVEFQVTPHNQRLQLHYPDADAVERVRKSGRFADFLIRDEVFHSQTWIEPQLNRWQVYAEIPADAVCGSNEPMENTQWLFSFGRYDYTRGVTEPVISSTSLHAKLDFHRQHEWGVMTFNNLAVK
ncbi:MAG TPA: hypothetical protein VHG89_10720 [Verrucomicrobiae bacterium]|nr:hypothetical protein [Verrucomicrobiae bacterium]